MKKAVVYWSGTGNTEAMARAVAEAAGAELFTASEFSGAKATGCSSGRTTAAQPA